MIAYVIMIVSLLLDGLLSNFLPYLVGDLTYFTPLFTLVSIFIIFPFYRKKEKTYLITAFLLGFCYDLFYTNLVFFNAVLFFFIAYLSMRVQKIFPIHFFSIILYTILIVSVYEGISGGILFLYNMVPVTFSKILYKISHSILLNVIYVEVIYFILNLIPKRFKKISIN